MSYNTAKDDPIDWLSDPNNEHSFLEAWIKYVSSDSGTPESEEFFWAVELIFDLNHHPQKLWDIILKLLETDMSDKAFAVLAAGPMEDLLANHGETYIQKVEQEAKTNSKFRKLLGGVWQNSMSDELWTSVQALVDKRW